MTQERIDHYRSFRAGREIDHMTRVLIRGQGQGYKVRQKRHKSVNDGCVDLKLDKEFFCRQYSRLRGLVLRHAGHIHHRNVAEMLSPASTIIISSLWATRMILCHPNT